VFGKIIKHLTLSTQYFPENDLIVFIDFLKCREQSPDCSENRTNRSPFPTIKQMNIFTK